MNSIVRLFALSFSTTLLSVVLASLYAVSTHGRLGELPGFFAWSIPIGFAVGVFGRKPRLQRWPSFARAIAAAGVGVSTAFGLTLAGWLLLGGWMLAWDFPVFYCWVVAGPCGMLGAALTDLRAERQVQGRHVVVSLALIALPLTLLSWYGSRPEPAVLIVYRDHPEFDAAQFEEPSSPLLRYPCSDRISGSS